MPAENQGVGVIGGRDDLSILAWSDIGPPSPKVHVYRYAEPLNIISLEGTAIFCSLLFYSPRTKYGNRFSFFLKPCGEH